MRIIKEYIVNNRLVIDKNVYFAIIFGLITVYTVILAFFQFVVSTKGIDKKRELRYLGESLIDYVVFKKLTIYRKVISKHYFIISFAIIVLYKPIVTIYGAYIAEKLVHELNAGWYFFVIINLGIILVVCLECSMCTQEIKKIMEKKNVENIIHKMNTEFRNKKFHQVDKEKSIYVLGNDLNRLKCAIKNEDTSIYYDEYINLIIDIFHDYKGKKKDNGTSLIYIMNEEFRLLENLLDGKYIKVKKILKKAVQELYFEFLETGLKTWEIEGNTGTISNDGEFYNNYLECRVWENLAKKLYDRGNVKSRCWLIERFYKESHSLNNEMFIKFCKKNLYGLMRESIWKLYQDNTKQVKFENIYKNVLSDPEVNDFYSEQLCQIIIQKNDIVANKLIDLVNTQNCTYILAYLIIYYSIYKFRFEWKYINVELLRELENKGNELKEEIERINRKIMYIEHRYDKAMCDELNEKLCKEITGEWLDGAYKEGRIDAFYITIIKLCVYEQKYIPGYKEGRIDAKIYFINELAMHKEVMQFKNVQDMVFSMQYSDFRKLKCWPENLHITLRSLLLLNIFITDEMIDEEIEYLYYKSVGDYLFIKCVEEREASRLKETIIRKAYLASDLSIEEYIENLKRECDTCGLKLTCIHTEKMKRYLQDIIYNGDELLTTSY